MFNNILFEAKKNEENLISLRRELHKVPEIGGELPKTRKIVCEFLDSVGIPYTLNPDDDGVVAEIKGGKSGKTLAFRADMDALHIDEQNDYTFKSCIDGQMHGCGHDAHTAILLITAKLLNEYKDNLCGSIRLIFQSGEETGTGAKEMLKLGVLDGVDAVCALHVGNIAGDEHNEGDLIVLPGPVSAGKNKFSITVIGKGGHSAFPHKAINPIIAAAKIVERCHCMMQNDYKDKAAVLTIATFNSGIDHNTIPEKAVLKGSIRVQDKDVRKEIGEKLGEIAAISSKEFDATCEFELKWGSETVMNDPQLSALVTKACKNILGDKNVITELPRPLMGSDDFTNYAALRPSVYFFLHTNNSDKGIVETNHNPRFDVDESVLWRGVAAYIAITKEFLS